MLVSSQSVLRRVVILFGLILGAVSTHAAPTEPNAGSLTAAERSYLVENLEASKKDFLASIHGLTAAQWTFKPGPDRWSVQECAEHIILAEDVLFTDEQRMMATPAVQRLPNSDAAHDRVLVAEVLDRTIKAKAPAAITPRGQFATPEAATEEFTKRRDHTIAYARSTNDALRVHVGDGPTGGINDAYQVLLVLAAHSERHTAQIREVQAVADFPPHIAIVSRSSENGQHDIDFDFGAWRTHISRLEKPLTGSRMRTETDGATVVHQVWGGRANMYVVLAGPVVTDMAKDLDIPRSSPESVAKAVFDGLGRGEEDIFTDPMSKRFSNEWRTSASKQLGREFSVYTPDKMAKSA